MERSRSYVVSLQGETYQFTDWQTAKDWLEMIGPNLPGKLTCYRNGKPGDTYTYETLFMK